jgi:hypothetical protein
MNYFEDEQTLRADGNDEVAIKTALDDIPYDANLSEDENENTVRELRTREVPIMVKESVIRDASSEYSDTKVKTGKFVSAAQPSF